jgi:NAD(P)-dependent dehydrogenase (short-subunit alcohol dehydrogenase family)
LITGASLSVGRSIALGLADHSAAIAVNYSATQRMRRSARPDGAQETHAAARSRGVDACLVEADLSEKGAGRRVVAAATAALGGV